MVPVKGGRLSMLLEVAGGQMRVTAGHWQELVASPENASGVVRRLIPGDVKIAATGSQRGEYSLLPLGSEGRWYEHTAAELKLDEEVLWQLPQDVNNLDSGDLWNLVPLRIELRQQGDRGWVALVRTRDPLIPGGIGEVRRQRAGSTWSERVSRFPLREGKPAAEAVLTTRNQPREIPLRIQFGGEAKTEALWHSNLQPPPLSFCREDGLPVTVIGPGRMRSSGSLEEVNLARLEPASEGGFGGSKVRFAWDFRLGEPPDVGWWEPAKPGLESWLPEYGEQLGFQVVLTRAEAVEGLRFVLRETTRYPGIAVNAVHAHLANQIASVPGQGSVAVELKAGPAVLAWTRHYPVATAAPIDAFPDLYFEQSRNPSAVIEGETLSRQTGGVCGTELRFDKVAPRVEAFVSVADWGAAGVLGVQAKIDGDWEDLQAKGPGVQPDGLTTRFPLDTNRDGIPDAFLKEHPGSDDRDGLDVFEESRGVLVGGRHVRLDPSKRDVWLIDYGQTLPEPEKREVERGLGGQGAQVHWLGLAEHRGERVGKADVIVIEALGANALPIILREDNPALQVQAWAAVRPHPGLKTVFVDPPTDARYLIEDLARSLAMSGKGGQK